MRKRTRTMVGNLFEVAGAGAVVVAVWLLSPVVGLLVLGAVLFLLGMAVAK